MLTDVLAAAAEFGDRDTTWGELAEALDPADRFVLMDLVVEVVNRAVEDVEAGT